MRAKLIGLMLSAGLLAAGVVPSLACAFHDQASADTQQQTAQTQPSAPTVTQ